MKQMENEEIHNAFSEEEIEKCFGIMQQLRPHLLDKNLFVAQVKRQIENGYHLVYFCDKGIIKAVAGFRLLEFLAWGKVLYIDDLITDSNARKNGHGSKLVKWLIEYAKKTGCDEVHLDSGPQRHDAHRLYLNHHFKIVAHHFAHTLSTAP